MNALATIHRSANNEATMLAMKESSVRADAGVVTSSSATETIASPTFFTELIAAGRAAASHHLRIAKARRYFGDRETNQAISEAETFKRLVDEQAAAVEHFPEVVMLLADIAFAPDLRRKEGGPIPEWAELLSARARTLLERMRG